MLSSYHLLKCLSKIQILLIFQSSIYSAFFAVQKQRRKVKIRQLAAVCQSHEKILAQVLLHRLVPTIATQQKKPSNLNSDKTSKICILLTHLSRWMLLSMLGWNYSIVWVNRILVKFTQTTYSLSELSITHSYSIYWVNLTIQNIE